MRRILVVEDEVIVGIALCEDLREAGWHVTVTQDGESALEQLELSRFDAAIIDIALPGLRGDDLARECRRRFPEMPLVLATGLDQRDVRAALGFDPGCEVLEKPHDFAAVRACLERLGVQFPAAS